MLAGFFCVMAGVESGGRMLYAFSRDKAVPGWRMWSRVPASLQVPVPAVWGVVLASFLLGLPMLDNSTTFSAVTSIAVIGGYTSYGIPIFLRCGANG